MQSKLMSLKLIFIMFLLASCSQTPKEIINIKNNKVYHSEQPPMQTAWCLGRAAEEKNTIWRPSVRHLDNNLIELVIQIVTSGDATTIAVARLKATKNGSIVNLYFTTRPIAIFSGGASGLRQALIDSCSLKQ